VNRRTLLQDLTLHGIAAAVADPTVRFALAMAADPPADPQSSPAAVDPFAAVSSKSTTAGSVACPTTACWST